MPIITVTVAAEAHIQSMLSKTKNGIGFRLSIKKTGCSGFAYVPQIIEHPVPTDLSFTTDKGLPIYIDPACEIFIKGLVMDFIENTGAGLKQKRLTFINPNEKNRCGCGESFTIE